MSVEWSQELRNIDGSAKSETEVGRLKPGRDTTDASGKMAGGPGFGVLSKTFRGDFA